MCHDISRVKVPSICQLHPDIMFQRVKTSIHNTQKKHIHFLFIHSCTQMQSYMQLNHHNIFVHYYRILYNVYSSTKQMLYIFLYNIYSVRWEMAYRLSLNKNMIHSHITDNYCQAVFVHNISDWYSSVYE